MRGKGNRTGSRWAARGVYTLSLDLGTRTRPELPVCTIQTPRLDPVYPPSPSRRTRTEGTRVRAVPFLTKTGGLA